MAIENVQRNSTGVVKVTALDAIGNVLPEYSAAASDIVITDGTNTYPVTAASWSNGIGLLNVSTPDKTGLVTLTMTVKGIATTIYPSPFQINLVDPYRGRFNTTGGKIIWDMDVTTNPTTSMTDYSGNGALGKENDSSALNRTAFTDTSQYRPNGTTSLLTLGKYRWGYTQAAPTDTPVGLVLSDPDKLSAYCDQVDYSNMPLKAFNFIVYQSFTNGQGSDLLTWFFRKSGDSGNTWDRFRLYREPDSGGDILVAQLSGNTTLPIYAAFAKTTDLITFIGVTISFSGSTMTAKIYVNGTPYTYTATTQRNLALSPGYTAFGTGALGLITPIGFSQGSAGNKHAILDFCAYGDEKSADFFQTNRAAWGL